MPEPEPHNVGAAREAWAVVAGAFKVTTGEREAARKLLDDLSEWQQWLLSHFGFSVTAEQALSLAEMWARVAAVQVDVRR